MLNGTKNRESPEQDEIREVLVTALERCWEGEVPFNEIEKAILLVRGTKGRFGGTKRCKVRK